MTRVKPLHLRLRPSAETLVRGGHPWIFDQSIRAQSRPGLAGEVTVIFDRNNQFLAAGLYDPHSPIRVRVLHRGKPLPLNALLLAERLRESMARRATVLDDRTTGARMVHGENDGLPGLVLDRYGSTLVLKIYTAIWMPWLPGVVETLLALVPKPERIVLRLSRNVQELPREVVPYREAQMLHGQEPPVPVIFQESGLRFEADVLRGQKTGFFLDQRENRRRVEKLAAGRDVLNAFSFSGGFSLYAARGGARTVTDLDLSAHALEGAKRNFVLNINDPAIAAAPHETIQADAFDWLAETNRRFDLVILDPPSLAKRETERPRAIEAYQRLARLGLARLRPGSVLVAASCSAHVSAEEFFGAVRAAATDANNPVEEFETTQHPADHPATFPEARYLKCVYLRCLRR